MSLVFEETYFKEEIREGFTISEKMKRAWAVYLDMLVTLDSICKKNDIKWFPGYGTLLGAIRHQGFIPWDDDVDICLFRDDYQKLMQILGRELPAGYIVSSRYHDKYKYKIDGYIKNSDIISYREDRLKRFYGCPYSVTIDIYPMDVIPEDEQEYSLHKFLYTAVYDVAQQYEVYKSDGSLPEYITTIENNTGFHFNTNEDLQGQLWYLAENIALMYNDTSSTKVAYVPDTITNKNGGLLERAWFAESIELPFENINIPVPIGYQEILKSIYGADYMIPVKNVASHSYPFYASQDEIFNAANRSST